MVMYLSQGGNPEYYRSNQIGQEDGKSRVKVKPNCQYCISYRLECSPEVEDYYLACSSFLNRTGTCSDCGQEYDRYVGCMFCEGREEEDDLG